MDVGKRIRELRKERGLTQGDLARRLNTHPQSVYRYESGTRIPNAPKLEEIAHALEVDPGVLFRDPLGAAPEEQRNTVNFPLPEELLPYAGITVITSLDPSGRRVLNIVPFGEPDSSTKRGMLQAALDRERDRTRANWSDG